MSLAKKRQDALEAQAGSTDRIKLGLMVGALVVVLLIFGWATFYLGDGETEENADPAPESEGIGNEDAGVLETYADGRVKVRVDVDDDDWRMGLGKEEPIDPAELTNVRDDTEGSQTVFEQEPLDYLVRYIVKEPSIRRKVRGFDALDRDTLLGAPSNYRGRAVEFKGRLLPGQDLPFEGSVEGVTTLHRGFIELLVPGKDGEEPGPLISYTSIGPPVFQDRAADPARPDSIVLVQGFFLKAWRARPPDGTAMVTTPHIVVRRFIESFRIEAQRTLDPFWFKVGAGSELDEAPFWLCLNYLQNLTPEVYREKRSQGEFEVRLIPEPHEAWPKGPIADDVITDFSSRGKLLEERYKLYQGHLIRLAGTLYAVDPVVPPENEGGIERYYDCVLALESNYIIPLILPFPPSRYGVTKGQNVEIEGYFYKRRIWETRSGDRRLQAPLILATDVIPIETGEGAYPFIGWLLGGIAIVFVVVLITMLAFDRRAAKNAPRRRRGRATPLVAPGDASSDGPGAASGASEDPEE